MKSKILAELASARGRGGLAELREENEARRGLEVLECHEKVRHRRGRVHGLVSLLFCLRTSVSTFNFQGIQN